MAFDQSNFSTVGAHSADSPKIYSYKSNDSLAVVTATDYFVKKSFQLDEGDSVYCRLSDGIFNLTINADKSTASQLLSVPLDNCRIGLFDYNDLATASSPISVTVAGSPVVLTNDEAGPNTNKLFAPVGVTDVWDSSNDMFDFTQLKLGDMVDIRLDLDIITVSPNTEIHVELFLGSGGGAFDVPFISDINFKSAGTHNVNRYNGIFMGSNDILTSGGQFKMSTDTDCSVTVNGWYTKILIRG